MGDYLARIRGKRIKEPIVCVETAPGQRASHDWSDYTIDFSDPDVGSERVILFSYILNPTKFVAFTAQIYNVNNYQSIIIYYKCNSGDKISQCKKRHPSKTVKKPLKAKLLIP